MKTECNRIEKTMELRGLSKKTRAEYKRQLRLLADHYEKPLHKLTTRQIEAYILTKVQAGYAGSTIGIIYAAIRFYFEHVLKKAAVTENVTRRIQRKQQIVPFLEQEEIPRFFNQIDNLKHRAIVGLIYSSGLRVSEALNLKVADIDSVKMQIFISNTKYRKQRYTLLSQRALILLREYWKQYKPESYLFPNPKNNTEKLNARSVQNVVKAAAKKAGFTKNITVHTLRHSFATHCLDNGVNLKVIQALLGHSSILSTQRYLHMSTRQRENVKSPLDLIEW